MFMKRPALIPCLALLAAVTFTPAVGCSNNGLNLAKVRGKVTYKGQAVKNGTVFFMPDDSKGTIGPPAVGSISADGSYIMSTESSGDGVIVGAHKIGITGMEENPVGNAPAPTPEADAEGYMKAKAKDAARAGVVTKDDNTFTDRGGVRWRYVVPKKYSNPRESGIIAKVERGSNTFNFDIDESGNVQINK